jgi:hypothetical protein
LLSTSSPSPVFAFEANNLPDVPSLSCLFPSLSPSPLPLCFVFVPGGDLWLFFSPFLFCFFVVCWCDVFVDLIVLPLGVGADFGGFHQNSPLGFLVLCFSLISSTRFVVHRLLLDLPRAPCDVLQCPYRDGFPASWRSALQPSVHWFRASLVSPLRHASFVSYRCWFSVCAQSATSLCWLSFVLFFSSLLFPCFVLFHVITCNNVLASLVRLDPLWS